MSSVRVEMQGLPNLRQLIEEYDNRIRFSRVRHNRQVSIATDDFAPVPGDIVSVIGPEALVAGIAERMGHVSTLHLELDRKQLDFRRMAVSNREVAGRPLAELDLMGRFAPPRPEFAAGTSTCWPPTTSSSTSVTGSGSPHPKPGWTRSATSSATVNMVLAG